MVSNNEELNSLNSHPRRAWQRRLQQVRPARHRERPLEARSAGAVAPQAHAFIYARDNPRCGASLCGILLGLLAKIKCSICSYQFNIWYTGHWLVDINLIFGIGELSQFTGGFRALAMDLHPSMAEASNHQTKSLSFAMHHPYVKAMPKPM